MPGRRRTPAEIENIVTQFRTSVNVRPRAYSLAPDFAA